MTRISMWMVVTSAIWVVGLGYAVSAQNKQDVEVPGGVSMSEFAGYENWQTVAVSTSGGVMAVIVGNPPMIAAYRAGIPANGQPVPDGAKLAKVHWKAKASALFPEATVPGELLNVDFMAKDSGRFASSGGWGYGAFEFDAASRAFRPATVTDTPPQRNDAKCGFACHTKAKTRDYLFTEYAPR